jgi:hypothetical protein
VSFSRDPNADAQASKPAAAKSREKAPVSRPTKYAIKMSRATIAQMIRDVGAKTGQKTERRSPNDAEFFV